ncbi:hypothetical protein MATL_G00122110 [Megalops atlanticus]|uniref:Uncharacterized protein n=1 Tax=Megalops atlanticus TaxID=7932 RepID=A0A9D3PYU4_MEGAT|nr:hypothetical protein MATL_G00122110 [Megalops atlanticus]
MRDRPMQITAIAPERKKAAATNPPSCAQTEHRGTTKRVQVSAVPENTTQSRLTALKHLIEGGILENKALTRFDRIRYRIKTLVSV